MPKKDDFIVDIDKYYKGKKRNKNVNSFKNRVMRGLKKTGKFIGNSAKEFQNYKKQQRSNKIKSLKQEATMLKLENKVKRLRKQNKDDVDDYLGGINII